MSKPKRENGFYRVNHQGEWTIAHYSTNIAKRGLWALVGFETYFEESEFREINEKPINEEPNKDAKCENCISMLDQTGMCYCTNVGEKKKLFIGEIFELAGHDYCATSDHFGNNIRFGRLDQV